VAEAPVVKEVGVRWKQLYCSREVRYRPAVVPAAVLGDAAVVVAESVVGLGCEGPGVVSLQEGWKERE
jgi:hypothetical protein